MERIIEKKLFDWKHSSNKKPLIIKGARQVGKTYSIRKFAKDNYKNLVEINFERDRQYVNLFKKTRNPNEILEFLKLMHLDVDFNEHTLFFMDEIQACADAITALKFLKESFPCDIISSGSMLGIAIVNSTSYPVGYVETWDMYPMSFVEFLSAYGVQDDMIISLKRSMLGATIIPEVVHERMNELFKTYIIVGGMPEVVAAYLKNHSYRDSLFVQREIVEGYINDMAKYAIAQDKIKTRECFSSIPVQLAKENKKFQYSVVNKGYNARYYDASLRWLEDSGTIIKVNRLAHITTPLSSEKELAVFKIYMADTGLLISQFEDGEVQKIISGEIGCYKGAIYENIAAQIFKRAKKACYYYEPSQHSEIDFVIEYEGDITPIEVKASKHTGSKSFQNFIKKHKSNQAFRFSQKNCDISTEGNVIYFPLYLLEFLLEEENTLSLS